MRLIALFRLKGIIYKAFRDLSGYCVRVSGHWGTEYLCLWFAEGIGVIRGGAVVVNAYLGFVLWAELVVKHNFLELKSKKFKFAYHICIFSG